MDFFEDFRSYATNGADQGTYMYNMHVCAYTSCEFSEGMPCMQHMYACVHVCMHVCVYIYIYTCTCKHTLMCFLGNLGLYALVHMYMTIYTCIHVYMYKYAHVISRRTWVVCNTCMHIHVHMYIHTFM
jgi:hypothetical protein